MPPSSRARLAGHGRGGAIKRESVRIGGPFHLREPIPGQHVRQRLDGRPIREMTSVHPSMGCRDSTTHCPTIWENITFFYGTFRPSGGLKMGIRRKAQTPGSSARLHRVGAVQPRWPLATGVCFFLSVRCCCYGMKGFNVSPSPPVPSCRNGSAFATNDQGSDQFFDIFCPNAVAMVCDRTPGQRTGHRHLR
jgi:hypothetical protein